MGNIGTDYGILRPFLCCLYAWYIGLYPTTKVSQNAICIHMVCRYSAPPPLCDLWPLMHEGVGGLDKGRALLGLVVINGHEFVGKSRESCQALAVFKFWRDSALILELTAVTFAKWHFSSCLVCFYFRCFAFQTKELRMLVIPAYKRHPRDYLKVALI